jgi:hypothetical protein
MHVLQTFLIGLAPHSLQDCTDVDDDRYVFNRAEPQEEPKLWQLRFDSSLNIYNEEGECLGWLRAIDGGWWLTLANQENPDRNLGIRSHGHHWVQLMLAEVEAAKVLLA